ncbi:MAG: LacI family DNA-binding transcriptional regulator [Janthinobacterium lividum]
MRIPISKGTNRHSRATIVDVAKKAGVHVSTASRALNPKADHRISSKTVSKIERIAEQLGYSPNPLASSLRTRRTGTVGLVVPNLGDPLFAPIIASVQERVAQDGYVTFVASSDYKPEKLLSIIETMARQHVAGLVIASFDLDDPAAGLCVEMGIPTVALLRDPRHPNLSSIAMDDVTGVEALVEHVLDLGHKVVAYITAPLAASTAQNRLAGFIAGSKLSKAAGCQFDVIESDAYDIEGGERVMRRMLASGLKATAILCFNDLLAVGALVALKSVGISCPEQVSVTGVNDLPFAALLTPPLTTLHNAGPRLGQEGAELLIKLIEKGDCPVEHILFPSHIVVRGSTGPAPENRHAHYSPSSRAARKPMRIKF